MERRKATYKLYPSATQAAVLKVMPRHHQQLYNAALQARIEAHRLAGVSIFYEGQGAGLTE